MLLVVESLISLKEANIVRNGVELIAEVSHTGNIYMGITNHKLASCCLNVLSKRLREI